MSRDKKVDTIDPDPGAMGYEEWIKGQCRYECAVCGRKFFDR